MDDFKAELKRFIDAACGHTELETIRAELNAQSQVIHDRIQEQTENNIDAKIDAATHAALDALHLTPERNIDTADLLNDAIRSICGPLIDVQTD